MFRGGHAVFFGRLSTKATTKAVPATRPDMSPLGNGAMEDKAMISPSARAPAALASAQQARTRRVVIRSLMLRL